MVSVQLPRPNFAGSTNAVSRIWRVGCEGEGIAETVAISARTISRVRLVCEIATLGTNAAVLIVLVAMGVMHSRFGWMVPLLGAPIAVGIVVWTLRLVRRIWRWNVSGKQNV
jgi:hypothetical protein